MASGGGSTTKLSTTVARRPGRVPVRSAPLAARGVRATFATFVGVLALLAAAVAPAAAQPPGPPAIPALSGFVTNACTGFPITNGLSVAVALIDPAAPFGSPPGPPAKPPNPNFGFFSYATLIQGASYQLTVSAPGYGPLGVVGAGAGVTVAMPPGPPIFPAGGGFGQGLLLDIRLVPSRLPTSCKPPGPPTFPALAGRVIDGTTGRGIDGLVIGVATIDPASGAFGIPQKPPNPNFGFFAYRTIEAGPFQLTISAPGYVPLDVAGGSTGVTLMMPPGPPALPAGQVVNESLVVAVQLAPIAPVSANGLPISASATGPRPGV